MAREAPGSASSTRSGSGSTASAGERYGIDVSHHQGAIAWDRVAGDAIEFAYVKATEGGDHVDSRFVENWEGAAAAGLQRGAYHFFTLCTPGTEQARNFLRVVPEDPAALPPAIDLEFAGNCAARPEPAVVTAELDAFIAAIERATGERAVLYVEGAWEERYPVKERTDRPLWIARLLQRPADDWWIWQVGAHFEVDGVSTRVDLDVMRPG